MAAAGAAAEAAAREAAEDAAEDEAKAAARAAAKAAQELKLREIIKMETKLEIKAAYDIGIVKPQSHKMAAHTLLESALSALKQRAEIRDSPNGERSAARAADILTSWTGHEWVEADIWRALIAVKMARESQGAFHADDLVDLAGYASLLGECRSMTDNS